MWEFFHNKSGATVSRKNMSTNNYVQMCKILQSRGLSLGYLLPGNDARIAVRA